MRVGAGPLRPASGRSATELRCQNVDCACVLEPTSIPVDFDVILTRLFCVQDASPAEAAASFRLPLFREAESAGDAVSFAVLVAEEVGRPSAARARAGAPMLPWPYCDDCLEDVLRVRSRRLAEAVARRDRAVALCSVLHEAEEGEVSVGGVVGAAGAGGGGADLCAALELTESAHNAALRAANERYARAARARAAIREKRAGTAAVARRVWSIQCMLLTRLTAARERLCALHLRSSRLRLNLGALRPLRVTSDAFFIWHSEPVRPDARGLYARCARAPPLVLTPPPPSPLIFSLRQ